jgi:hypothetical protein
VQRRMHGGRGLPTRRAALGVDVQIGDEASHSARTGLFERRPRRSNLRALHDANSRESVSSAKGVLVVGTGLPALAAGHSEPLVARATVR